MKFEVLIVTSKSDRHTIEAETPEEAVKKAEGLYLPSTIKHVVEVRRASDGKPA